MHTSTLLETGLMPQPTLLRCSIYPPATDCRIVVAMSGGVDSSVVAALAMPAVPK